ncbi:unnamed protein product [Tenebrio molitor]|nr:unnamed protein product [Tenebrio molitor]
MQNFWVSFDSCDTIDTRRSKCATVDNCSNWMIIGERKSEKKKQVKLNRKKYVIKFSNFHGNVLVFWV